MPENNYSKEASLASMQKVADIIAKEHGQLRLNIHRRPDLTMKKPPEFYE